MANQTSENSRAFAVDDVLVVTDPIWTQSLAENLRWRLKREVLVLPGDNRAVANVAVHDARNRDMCVARCIVSRVHPFIEAVHTAFSQHRRLSLRRIAYGSYSRKDLATTSRKTKRRCGAGWSAIRAEKRCRR